MTVHALVTGSLFRSAESRVSKNGRSYVKATVKEVTGDETRWVNIVAFSDTAQAELMRLADGDSLSVQGQLNSSIYTAADGNAKVSLSIVANCVLALRQPPRERKAAAFGLPETRARQERCAGSWSAASGDPNDDIDFGGDA